MSGPIRRLSDASLLNSMSPVGKRSRQIRLEEKSLTSQEIEIAEVDDQQRHRLRVFAILKAKMIDEPSSKNNDKLTQKLRDSTKLL